MGLLELALSSLGLVVATGAFVVALLALAGSYDDLVCKLVSLVYDPEVEVTLQDAGADTEKQYHVTEDGFEPTYADEFRIDYHRFENRVTAADGGMVRTFTFSVALDGYDDREATARLRVETDPMVYLTYDEDRRRDVEDGYRAITRGDRREFTFAESTVSSEDPYWFTPTFEVQMPPEGEFREFEVEAEVDVSVDASEFEVPLLGIDLPERVGEVEFQTIEREWTIVGPDHPEFGS